MKISMKTDYAFRVLFTLVEHYGRGPIPIRELARRNDVPKRFLEQIMLQMKSQEWVSSTMGKQGGYVLAKPPHKITAGEIVRHFDGVLSPIACVSVNSYKHCNQESVCRFRRLFLDIRNYIDNLMENTSLQTIFQGSPVNREEVFEPKFIGGAGI